MAKKLGNIKMPKELEEIIKESSNAEASEKPADYDVKEYNSESFLLRFDRLIDPVILSMFFGLYKSQELPPEDPETKFDLEGSYEFGVDIEEYREIFNNLLLCLWIHKNSFPTSKDVSEFRKRLYNFTKKILDDDYFRGVIIPFYTKKAAESTRGRSFLARMRGSGYVRYKKEKMSMASQEFICKEFAERQEEFGDLIIKPLSKKV